MTMKINNKDEKVLEQTEEMDFGEGLSERLGLNKRDEAMTAVKGTEKTVSPGSVFKPGEVVNTAGSRNAIQRQEQVGGIQSGFAARPEDNRYGKVGKDLDQPKG